MERRVIIQWTGTARQQLSELPKKVRQGILKKARQLRESDDPASVHKPLVAPLQGYYRFTYSRYRAVYSVTEDPLASGDVLVYVRIRFIAVGKRIERDRKDIFKIAEKMVKLELVDPMNYDDDDIEIDSD